MDAIRIRLSCALGEGLEFSRVFDEHADTHLLPRVGVGPHLQDARFENCRMAVKRQQREQAVLACGHIAQFHTLIDKRDSFGVIRVFGLGDEVDRHTGLEIVQNKRPIPMLEPGDEECIDAARRFVHGSSIPRIAFDGCRIQRSSD